MTEEKAKSLIGRKVRGFKFEDFTDDISYHPSMDEYIGKVGSIIDISLTKNFIVTFDNYSWSYPSSLIEAHLVEESVGKRISELKQSDLNNIDCMEIVSRTDCNKQDLIKVQDIINQNEQLKADKEALVKSLEIYLNAGHKEARRQASIIARQTLEKHGK